MLKWQANSQIRNQYKIYISSLVNIILHAQAVIIIVIIILTILHRVRKFITINSKKPWSNLRVIYMCSLCINIKLLVWSCERHSIRQYHWLLWRHPFLSHWPHSLQWNTSEWTWSSWFNSNDEYEVLIYYLILLSM